MATQERVVVNCRYRYLFAHKKTNRTVESGMPTQLATGEEAERFYFCGCLCVWGAGEREYREERERERMLGDKILLDKSALNSICGVGI